MSNEGMFLAIRTAILQFYTFTAVSDVNHNNTKSKEQNQPKNEEV